MRTKILFGRFFSHYLEYCFHVLFYYYYYYFLTINQKKKKKHQLDHSHWRPQLATIHSNTTTGNHILTHCKTHRQPLGLRSAKPSTTAKLIANPCTTARPPPDLQDDADRNHRETTARPPPDLQDDADHLKPIPTVNPQKSTANPPKIQKKPTANSTKIQVYGFCRRSPLRPRPILRRLRGFEESLGERET